jgi:hypothetical protein
VAVEQTQGALVFMLSKHAPLHLFPVPLALSVNLSRALYPSGAKNGARQGAQRGGARIGL